MKTQTVHVRWMIRRDLPAVLGFEKRCFEFPWTEQDFVSCLRQRNNIGMVAELGDQVVGYMVYELHKTKLHLLSIAVDPDYSRQGIGAAMVEKLINKLSYQRRKRIALEVRETNLAAQLFFKALGFRATCVLHQWFENCDDDAYVMEFRVSDVSASNARVG